MISRSKSGQPVSRPVDLQRTSDIAQDVARVGAMNVDALRSEWRRVFGSQPPPALSKDLLARAISYRLQEQALGGLGPPAARLLRALLKPGVEPPRQVKVGSVIVREHKGVLHEVMAVPGGFCWRGETYDSLSIIAKKITGVSWNGPRFFGLRTRKNAADQRNSGTLESPDKTGSSAAEGPTPRRGRRSSFRSTSSPTGARP